MTHCRYCGRLLVEVTERSTLHDRATGVREVNVWLQCPRFPRNSLAHLLFSGGRPHDSYLRDNPLLAREYR